MGIMRLYLVSYRGKSKHDNLVNLGACDRWDKINDILREFKVDEIELTEEDEQGTYPIFLPIPLSIAYISIDSIIVY